MRLGEEIRSHVVRVTAAARGGFPRAAAPAGADRLGRSWRRSLEQHQVDPGLASLPRVLDAAALRDRQERLETFLRIARHGLGQLHAQVRESSYCVLLTDAEGVTIDLRGVPALDREFQAEGFRVGTCWSEREEGTCGVGTTIVDRAPTLVHKAEHFRAHNIAFTCSAAPILGPQDELLGVLDASALSSPDDRASQGLVFRLVTHTALLVENAFFLDTFRSRWILQLSPTREFLDVQLEHLLAFDDAGRIVGANRRARTELLARGPVAPARIEDLFDLRADGAIRMAHERPGIAIPLRLRPGGERLFALVRAPAQGPTRRPAPPRPAAPGAPAPGGPAPRGFAGLTTADPRVARDVERALRLADRKVPILLLGETGTGKDAFARAIHEASARRDAPFVALNCAALPESLIEAELFGYREGAFTGARARGVKGKVALASGGTLFLDEIGDMPLALQTRLLRVLAEAEVLPLGAAAPEAVDLNVVCATHRDLDALVREGRFREDLLYRLNGAVIRLPALRDRADVLAVVEQVFAEEAALAGAAAPLPAALAARLAGYAWPGNIRQLRNALRYALAVAGEEPVGAEHLPAEIADALDGRPAAVSGGAPEAPARPGASAEPAPAAPPVSAPDSSPAPAPAHGLAEAAAGGGEREQLVAALRRNRWHVAAAARQLGVSRATLYRRMTRLRVVPPNWADEEG